MMPYLSIDTESTGLDADNCRLLEIGAVAELDWVTPVEALPSFRVLLYYPFYTGEPTALAMNAILFAEIAADGPDVVTPSVAVQKLHDFIALHFGKRESGEAETVTLAGKNCSAFDLPFLRKLPTWKDRIRHRNRVLDVGNLWFNPATDDRLPDTAECLRRAGVTNPKPHSALDDARAVVAMVRARYAVKEGRVAA